MTSEQLLIMLVRSVLCRTEIAYAPTFAEFKAVYKLAAKHDLAHLMYIALESGDALPKPGDDAELAFLNTAWEQVLTVQYRYVKLEAELAHIREVLEREEIAYIPLKGAVLRVLYPEPWLRTSCDLDVLVHDEDLDRAAAALIAEGFVSDGVRNYHDMSLFCDGVHLELHHNVLERRPQMDALLSQIWEHTVSKGCQHLETPDFFLFHHVAHMAYHFLHGGCGVRTVMDLWLLRQSGRIDENAVRALCEQAELLTFYDHMCHLANIWFGDGQHDDITRRIERFVLHGGAYGSRAQNTAANAIRHGKLGLAWHIVFMPYRDLKRIYPALDGKPLLTPYYQLRRLMKRLSQKHGKSALARVNAACRQSQEDITAVGEILSVVGLHNTSEVEK